MPNGPWLGPDLPKSSPSDKILDRLILFDPTRFIDDKTTPLSYMMQPATVILRYKDKFGRELVDVIFDHSPNQISHGHFTQFAKCIIKE